MILTLIVIMVEVQKLVQNKREREGREEKREKERICIYARVCENYKIIKM